MGEKWADYGISEVRYNSKGTHIEQVKVHVDNGDTMEPANVWTRENVISYLDKNYSFVTIIKKNNGNWGFGAKVEIITVNGSKYIRTNRNKIAMDNLEDLPKF